LFNPIILFIVAIDGESTSSSGPQKIYTAKKLSLFPKNLQGLRGELYPPKCKREPQIGKEQKINKKGRRK
jgi:hypothetical protein